MSYFKVFFRLTIVNILVISYLNCNAQELIWTDSFKVVCSETFKNGKFTLKKKVDLQDYRKNPQGATYYKTTFAVDLEFDNQIATSIVDSLLYTSAKEDLGMMPCVLIDEEKNLISVFSNSKAEDSLFGMDGYIYQMTIGTNKWEKENLFKTANFGWFSFFGGSNNGNPELWHFSYAGGVAMLSVRVAPNKWGTIPIEPIREDVVKQKYPTHKNVLITSSPGVDRMKANE